MTKAEILNLAERDRMELLMRSPFYGSIICACELVPVRDPKVTLACTDCRRIFLSADAYPLFSAEQRVAVLAHEVLHIALMHAFRVGLRDEKRFAYAADVEIHFILRDTFEEPYELKYKEDWVDLSAEQIYELLPETVPDASDFCFPTPDNTKPKNEAEESDQDAKMDGSDGNTQSGDGSEEDDAENGDAQSGDGSDKDDAENGDTQSGDEDGSDGESSTEGTQSEANEDEMQPFEPNFDSETEMMCQTAAQNAVQLAKMGDGTEEGTDVGDGRGSVPAGLLKLIEQLRKPRVNWRILLRQYIRDCRDGSYHWLPPNRRYIARKMYIPGRRDKVFRGVIALDTSGSTCEVLPDFVSELWGLMRSFGHFELTIIECDAEIHNVWKVNQYDKNIDLSKHEFCGMGGTSFIPVFEYIQKNIPNPNVLIFFTDGDGDCIERKPSYPVLWLLPPGSEAPVDWGQKIYYEEK